MDGLKDKNGKLKKSWLIGGIVVLVVIVGLIVLMPRHLSGKYSHTTDLLLAKSTDTLEFKGSKVTEFDGNKKINEGTYKLKGDQLTMKINETNMTATLAKDKKSFVVDSADGLANLAKGFKYTKNAD